MRQRSGFKWLEAGLFLSGLAVLFGQTVRIMLGAEEIWPAGWGFFISGLGLIVPRWLASSHWLQVQADVTGATSEETPTVGFEYSVGDRTLEGQITETSGLRAGDRLTLHVNMDNPQEFFAVTWAPVVIGLGFIFAGFILGVSGKTIG